MAGVDPTAYDWLADSELQVAGCVTVVPGAETAAVATAFGHEEADGGSGDARFADRAASGELGDRGDEIWVAASPDAALVFEFNGFEGTRDGVLREASRAGTAKIAASLFWNVNGAVQVTCARRGKVVTSVDLSYVEEDDLATVPRALRPLARLCVGDDGADPLAVGAAMVETLTGVGFTRTDLDGSSPRRIVSRPSDLTTYEPGRRVYGPLDDLLPELPEALAALAVPHLRRLAEWSAQAAVREAGLTEEPSVRAVLDRFGTGEATSVPPGLEVLRRRFAAESERVTRETEDSGDESSIGALAEYHARLPVHAVDAVRCTSHPDAYSAAVGALARAASTFSCTRLDRGVRFEEDEHGRRFTALDPSPRLTEFADVVRRMLASGPDEWDVLTSLLPAPLTPSELAGAAEVDRRLQEAGAFATWQIVAPASYLTLDAGLSEVDPVVAREAAVLERYKQLERRDRAIAARGAITAGAVEPQNEGGFAVAFSDGVRVERLPAGQAAGRLFLTFVFTSEFELDLWSDRRSSPDERISYSGPDGRIHPGNGSGGSTATFTHWHTDLDVAGRPWIRLRYLDGGTAVASEKITLA